MCFSLCLRLSGKGSNHFPQLQLSHAAHKLSSNRGGYGRDNIYQIWIDLERASSEEEEPLVISVKAASHITQLPKKLFVVSMIQLATLSLGSQRSRRRHGYRSYIVEVILLCTLSYFSESLSLYLSLNLSRSYLGALGDSVKLLVKFQGKYPDTHSIHSEVLGLITINYSSGIWSLTSFK